LVFAEKFLRPRRGDLKMRISISTGCAALCLRQAALHPRLQPVAPSGASRRRIATMLDTPIYFTKGDNFQRIIFDEIRLADTLVETSPE
jgi:hypothetical protein